MYEKLDKIRADLEKARQKRAEADNKVKQLEQRLKEAESSQILADVGAMNLSPEQLAQFLQMVSNGQLKVPGSNTNPVTPVQVVKNYETKKEETAEESEDFEDEDE